jgi:hypothetical protein
MTSATDAPRLTRRRSRLVGVGAAVFGALAIWVAAVPVLGVEPTVESWDGGTMTVGLGLVVITSAAAALAGWATLAALERLARRPGPIWVTGATLALLASLGMPASAAVSTAAMVTLIAMHLVVGAVLIPTLLRSVR